VLSARHAVFGLGGLAIEWLAGSLVALPRSSPPAGVPGGAAF